MRLALLPAGVLAVLLIALRLAPDTRALDTPHHTDILDIHHLPLGDGRVGSNPRRGFVMSCMTQFNGHAPGAQRVGEWIHYDKLRGDTWDLTEKLSIEGKVNWPQATFKIATQGSGRTVSRILQGNGLPVDTPTGTFPVAPNDPASQVDRNPNSIQPQQVALTLPSNPEAAATPSCVNMGMIGVALNGVAIFNALDAGGRDAVAHEVQDVCGGHPEMRGQYHYHGPSSCLPNQTANETLVGYALDGFGIYSLYDAQGRELTDADLDECHGRTSEVLWDGTLVPMYHYVLTREYPYTLGCFRGAPAHIAGPGGRGGMGGPPNGRRPNGPPPFGGPPPN